MGGDVSKGNTSNIDKQSDQALKDTPKEPSMEQMRHVSYCWAHNFKSEGCNCYAFLCNKNHVCSICCWGDHTQYDCPFNIRTEAVTMEGKREIPSLKEWSNMRSCWFYNFSLRGCQNGKVSCPKDHRCSECKAFSHGNLNCLQVRKKREAELKDVLPSIEEWETNTTCWYYNFSTKICSNHILCKKQHKCSNCFQPGHPLLTCPEPIAENLATRAALKQEEALRVKKQQELEEEIVRKQNELKQEEEMRAKKQQDEEKLRKQKKLKQEEEMRAKKQQELDEEKLRKQKKKTLQQEVMRENQRELEEEKKKIQEIEDEEKLLLEKLESSRNSSRKAVEATIEFSMQTHQMGTNVMKGLAGATANLYNDAGYFDRPNGYDRDHNRSMFAIEEGSASTSTVSGLPRM